MFRFLQVLCVSLFVLLSFFFLSLCLSVLILFTDSDYSFGIFTLFWIIFSCFIHFSIYFFQFLSNDDGQCLQFSLKKDGKGNPFVDFFSLYSRRSFLLISLAFENSLSITLSLYPCLLGTAIRHCNALRLQW